MWNVLEKIKNRTSGLFIGIKGDRLEVEVEGHGRVLLKRETWSKRNRAGQVVGSRTQYPLVLFFACTCHKTQGLTLPGVVVHCSKEFVPGLLYVTVSRVRKVEELQICQFNGKQLLQPPPDALEVCKCSEEMRPDLTCCINQQLDSALFKVGDIGEDFVEEDGDVPEVLPVDAYPDGLVSSYFAKEGDELMVDLGTVFLELDNSENQFSQPPEHYE